MQSVTTQHKKMFASTGLNLDENDISAVVHRTQTYQECLLLVMQITGNAQAITAEAGTGCMGALDCEKFLSHKLCLNLLLISTTGIFT
jgi:hypothetical protein